MTGDPKGEAGGATPIRLQREPRPSSAYELPGEVSEQLQTLRLDPGRPLLAVDADEVLLDFAAHLGRWMEGEGWTLNLTEYRLEGAIRRIDDGRPAERKDVGALIAKFFAEEAENQEALPGAAAALEALSEQAQILVLTNVPLAQREARIRCLTSQGIDYPVVANSGGKGRALRWLWDRTEQPVAFIDDADPQLASAKTHAPDVFRLHFVASDLLLRVTGEPLHADASARDWETAHRLLAEALAR